MPEGGNGKYGYHVIVWDESEREFEIVEMRKSIEHEETGNGWHMHNLVTEGMSHAKSRSARSGATPKRQSSC